MKTLDVETEHPRAQAYLRIAAVLSVVLVPFLAGATSRAIGRAGGGIATVTVMAWAIVLGTAIYGMHRWLGARRATLEVGPVGLALRRGSSVQHIPRESIDGALVVYGASRDRVHLTLSDEPKLVVAVPKGEGDEVVRALELDRSRGGTELRVTSEGQRVAQTAFGAFIGAIVGALVGLIPGAIVGAATHVSAFGWVVGLAFVAAGMWGGAKVLGKLVADMRIAADGINYRNGFDSRAGFIPFSQFAGIRVLRKGGHKQTIDNIEVVLEGGTAKIVASLDATRAGETNAIVRRLEAAWEEWRETEHDGASVERVFETGATSVSEWLGDLRRVATERDGYRKKTLETEQLLRVLENPQAPAKHRIGAAVMLRVRAPEAREPIRIAADDTANPKLRVALSTIASEEIEEAEIAEALAAEGSEADRRA